MLVHFVKSTCLYSVNPFSTLFSANIQHNYPILFGICSTFLPAGLAFRFPSKSNYIFFFRESYPYRHLVLNNWVFLSDLFYKMNENVKQNQPVSLFSFLILRVAGLLNSADFSRSCTSSSCNISLSFSSSALTQAKIW